MAIGLKIKHSTGEITTGTGNLTLNAAGDLVLDYATFPSSDGTAGYILSTDGAGNLSWVVDSGGIALTDLSVTTASAGTAALAYNNGSGVFTYTPPDLSSYLTSIAANSINDTHIDWGVGYQQISTQDIPENVNLYYTQGRVDGRVDVGFSIKSTSDLSEGTNLYYTDARADARIGAASIGDLSDAYYTGESLGIGTDALANDTGSNLRNVAIGTGALYSNTSGNYSVAIGNKAGYSSTLSGQLWIANSDNGSGTKNATWIYGDSSYNIELPNGNLTVSGTITASGYNNANWNTAYGWGNHASGGYLTSTGVLSSHTNVHTAAPTDGQVLTWVNANSRWEPAAGGGGGGGIALTDLSVTTASAGTAALAYNSGTGVFTYTPPNLSSYLTSETFTSLVQDTSPQLGGTLDANSNTIDMGANIITDAKVFNYDVCVATTPSWNLAYVHSIAAHAPVGAEANANSFQTVAVSGQSNVVADTTTDTLTLVAGSNMTITTTAGTDTVTFAAAGGGGNAFETIAVSGQGNVVADTATDTLTFVAGTGITLATNAGTDSITINASGGAGTQNVFETVAITGQASVVADTPTDTLTFVAGSNMTITTSFPDTITFASSGGGGGGGSSSESFTINYSAGGGSISSVSNLPAGWSGSINGDNVTITHTAGGQPMGISFYGLDKSGGTPVWKYSYPTSTYPVTFPDSSGVISTTEFTLNVGTTATGANTGTPFATSLANVKVIF